jgi:hypothetical protein
MGKVLTAGRKEKWLGWRKSSILSTPNILVPQIIAVIVLFGMLSKKCDRMLQNKNVKHFKITVRSAR